MPRKPPACDPLPQLADKLLEPVAEFMELSAHEDHGPEVQTTFQALIAKERKQYGQLHPDDAVWFDQIAALSVGYRFGLLMAHRLGSGSRGGRRAA